MPGFRAIALLATAISSVSAHPRHTHNALQSYGVPYKPYFSSGTPTSALPYGPTGTAPATNPRPTYLYGTNAGGHLIVEKWMTPDLFEGTNATDQHTLDQTDGARAKLQNHWDTYYTKDDFAAMKKWGLNAVRIPIGFWAYDNAATPYLSGADAYLERMIEWCRELGLWVLVDCHGSPGSQNGFDNSGRSGDALWQTEDNLHRSIGVLRIMAAKYGSMAYSDVVYGLQLVNEPISWKQSTLNVTQDWTQKAYRSVRDAAQNKDLVIVMHDGFMGPSQWVDVGNAIMSNHSSSATAGFAVDTHLYQNQVEADKWLTQPEHIAKACDWTQTNLLPQNSSLPVVVGEFSAATDICANPDGSTVAGTACWIDGCQCANNVDIQWWKQPLKDVTRQFFEAELEAFEKGAQGWFVWSWKGPGAWGMENLIREGVVGQSVHDRKFEGQCN
jgi:glucan 1,3-beta-glucosidase